jgi:uncharacterized membrane protein YGL010W
MREDHVRQAVIAAIELQNVHRNATNLVTHLIAVPLFVFGDFLLIAGTVIDLWLVVPALLSVVVSLGSQKFGYLLAGVNPGAPLRGFA